MGRKDWSPETHHAQIGDMDSAEARARELVERASFNEAIVVIDELIAEVEKMDLPARFSAEKPAYGDPALGGMGEPENLAPRFRGLTEAQYKRAQLLMHLESIKTEIIANIGSLHVVIMDIEATKRGWQKTKINVL